MTKKELLKKYLAYYMPIIEGTKKGTKKGSQKGSQKGPKTKKSSGSYGSYLNALRFWAIDEILKNWFVVNNGKKYYESVVLINANDGKRKPFGKWEKDSYLECSERHYHLCNYYIDHIKDKNKLIDAEKRADQSNLELGYDYLNYIAAFLSVNDLVHALTIIDIVMGIVQKAIDHYKDYKKDNDQNATVDDNDFKHLKDSRSALAIMREWIEFGTEKRDRKYSLIFTQDVRDAGKISPLNNAELDILRYGIDPKLINKIDGAGALVREIGINKFIQYAIEQSYFFEPKIVKEQMTDIVNAFKNTPSPTDLPARSSNKVSESDETEIDEPASEETVSENTVDTYDENSSEKVHYHQYVDYVRTALAFAEEAQKKVKDVREKKKKIEKENAIKAAKEALTVAQVALGKTNNNHEVQEKVKVAEGVVKSAETFVYGSNMQGKQPDKNSAEKKVQKSKYRLFHSSDMKIDYPIIVDNDGNKAVRDLIKDKTGYSVSEGKNSIFQNYKISHIWGKAYDPRYFTNLWNIVLVPAWANDLLDKNAVEKTLESKFKSTIMRICEALYFIDSDQNKNTIESKQWKVLDMNNAPKNNKQDIISSTVKIQTSEDTITIKDTAATDSTWPYLINIIKEKKVITKDGDKRMDNPVVGDIVKYAVKIKKEATKRSAKKQKKAAKQ